MLSFNGTSSGRRAINENHSCTQKCLAPCKNSGLIIVRRFYASLPIFAVMNKTRSRHTPPGYRRAHWYAVSFVRQTPIKKAPKPKRSKPRQFTIAPPNKQQRQGNTTASRRRHGWPCPACNRNFETIGYLRNHIEARHLLQYFHLLSNRRQREIRKTQPWRMPTPPRVTVVTRDARPVSSRFGATSNVAPSQPKPKPPPTKRPEVVDLISKPPRERSA